ncbi:MAG: hypothetical protein K9M75_00205 [Phycisphaerae bacterium]|nr:hypothetical protein [Phycisphaerae bacterium]
MNVKIDDYYQTDVESNALEGRDKYIMDRWDQLFAHLREGFNNMINYLLLINGAGSVTTLAFMGASPAARSMTSLRLSAFFFSLGIIFIGVLRAIIVHRAAGFFNAWRRDVKKYHSEQVAFSKMTANDDNRTQTAPIEFIAGYACGLSFIIASIAGAISLFTFN